MNANMLFVNPMKKESVVVFHPPPLRKVVKMVRCRAVRRTVHQGDEQRKKTNDMQYQHSSFDLGDQTSKVCIHKKCIEYHSIEQKRLVPTLEIVGRMVQDE